MTTKRRPHDLTDALVDAGGRCLTTIGPLVDAADPRGLVEPRSRLLCAALGALSRATFHDLGGKGEGYDVERAGALLSLLTKVDDQIIDARPFHGSGDRRDLTDRTRAYLAPTLASLRAARPANDEPRCALAAELGASLRALSSRFLEPSRIDHVIDLIAEGWEVQVEAVRVLTSHPALVTSAEVASVTRRISGMWLLMIAAIGMLPSGARPLADAEEQAFGDFGWVIQRADAFADLGKDLADGHLSSWPGKMLYERAGEVYLRAAREGDIDLVYRLARERGVERDGLPGEDEVDSLARLLPDLPRTRELLLWIAHHLAGRYAVDPRAQRAEVEPCLAP